MITPLPLALLSLLILISGGLLYHFRQLLKEKEKVLGAVRRINSIILEEIDFESVAQKVADVIPNELRFATGVVAILDNERGVLRRIAASKTTEAREAIKSLSIPFHLIDVPVDDPHNLMARSIRENKSFITHDVYDVLGPVLSRAEAANVQRIMSTKTTVVYPIYIHNKPIGVFVASTKKEGRELSEYEFDIIQAFVEGSAIALQHSILYKTVKDRTEELKFANNRLKELDKLKDDFVSIASHELRTPMTAVRSYAWMALHRSDIPLTEKLKKYLSRTLISTERLINLVNDMLNISRIESGRIAITPSSFDARSLVADVVAEIEPKAKEKNIHLEVVSCEIPKVFADPDKVHQILLNLLGNALKFTTPDGTVTINFFTDGKMVELSVKDSGVGISREDQPKLFTKFGRLDNSYVAVSSAGGTGLGLYISKSLVELMKGKIWVNSEGLGRGSTFTFSLPVATSNVLDRRADYTKVVTGEERHLEPVAI